MTITKIERQKKAKGRYSVFLDGEFAFGIFEDTLVKFGLRKGDSPDEKKIKEIREFDELAFGKKIAYDLLSYKQRSRKDILQRLKKKKISDMTAKNVVSLLEEQGYLNDENYANNYLGEKLKRKPMGKRLAAQKLFEKGIEKEIAQKIIADNFDEENETRLALELLKKYIKKIKNPDAAERKRKCFRYLMSRGFEYETAAKILNETAAEI